MLFNGLLRITLPKFSFEAAVTDWTGSLFGLSLSTVGYKLRKLCLYFKSENSETVGDMLPIKQVR